MTTKVNGRDVLSPDELSEFLTLKRPDDIPDARWLRLQIEAERIVTGHYPWCEDHRAANEADGGWCYREQATPFGSIDMGNGTTDGSVIISIDVRHGDGGRESVTELSVGQAACLASHLETFADLARHGGVQA